MEDLYSVPLNLLVGKFLSKSIKILILGPFLRNFDLNSLSTIDLIFLLTFFLVTYWLFPGNLLVTNGYLVVSSGYLITITGYFWLLSVTFLYFWFLVLVTTLKIMKNLFFLIPT